MDLHFLTILFLVACVGFAKISLNTWTHIVCQRNGILLEFYINGTFVGQYSTNTNFDSTSLSNLNQITLGMANDKTNTDPNYHMKGNLSHVKISITKRYIMSFIPQNDLTPLTDEISSTLFFNAALIYVLS